MFWTPLPSRTDRVSSPLPVVLNDGEQASFYFVLTTFKDLKLSNYFINKHFIKLYISTSVGKKFKSKIEKNLKNLIIKNK